MQVHARLNQLRMSPRKVRLVLGLIRGLPVPAAMRQLEFSGKAAARPVLKLLKSAMANAEHNFNLNPAELMIAKATADGGPVLHRSMPRAFGRATPIRQRTAHIHLILSDESIADVHRSTKRSKTTDSAVKETKEVEPKEKKTRAAKPAAKKTTAKKTRTASAK